ncbi:HD domain-containing protein [Thermosporothrix hazakensis]|jgi:hypothetical protein|uniref:HD domain-containing protein n=1 Tax=Thermosporothrix hazakensis TaxID=644383 RepID=A0A326U1P2_THEHA|nr:HD domain-containing protein [Thermosporothrix hazakensis]PZW24881.1 HD domain-containing protein [Thermosporothrix hazakensis]GCE46431.1 metal-dependent phosphohydrolase, HD subdomain protein [Thermosporothrix hazakensis]
MLTIAQAARFAESYLAPLGARWLHVQGVVRQAYSVSRILNDKEHDYLISAAYLHDIGYAPSLQKTGFHPLDGAYFVRSLGDLRLASLVAHHSEARFEARLKGLEEQLSEFPREESPLADALIYCDFTTSPFGATISMQERVADIMSRYGKEHPVTQALHLALPTLTEAIERMEKRLQASSSSL